MKKKRFNRAMWGVLWIVLAVMIFGKTFSWWDYSIVQENWCLILVIVFAVVMLGSGISVIPTVAFLVSLVLYLNTIGLWNYVSIQHLVSPICLLVLGLNLLIRGLIALARRNVESYERKDYYGVAFGSIETLPRQKEFKGGRLDAIFGGTNLDLRDAVLSKNVQIDATVLFGGVHIIVPEGVKIKNNTTSLFGSVSDKRYYNKHPEGPTIYLNGICMFGGIEIK